MSDALVFDDITTFEVDQDRLHEAIDMYPTVHCIRAGLDGKQWLSISLGILVNIDNGRVLGTFGGLLLVIRGIDGMQPFQMFAPTPASRESFQVPCTRLHGTEGVWFDGARFVGGPDLRIFHSLSRVIFELAVRVF